MKLIREGDKGDPPPFGTFKRVGIEVDDPVRAKAPFFAVDDAFFSHLTLGVEVRHPGAGLLPIALTGCIFLDNKVGMDFAKVSADLTSSSVVGHQTGILITGGSTLGLKKVTEMNNVVFMDSSGN